MNMKPGCIDLQRTNEVRKRFFTYLESKKPEERQELLFELLFNTVVAFSDVGMLEELGSRLANGQMTNPEEIARMESEARELAFLESKDFQGRCAELKDTAKDALTDYMSCDAHQRHLLCRSHFKELRAGSFNTWSEVSTAA